MAERIFVDELLTHTDWLRGLARELVRDPHTADDLAQSSLTAALSDPPRWSGSRLRGWLHRVMVNRLRQGRRNDGNHERLHRNLARAAEAPSTLTVVARTEIQGALIQALLALEEPYRTTILHRYYDNRSAAEIARADDLSQSTVRNRLHRGLARLRERLRKRYGGDDAQWLPAAVALGSQEPLGAVRKGGPFLRLAKSQKLAVAGVSLIGLAVLGTLLVPSGGRPIPPETVLASDDGRATAADKSSNAPQEDPVREPLPLQRAQLDGPDTETFELRVLGPDAMPASRAQVLFVPLAHAQQENLLRSGPQHPHSEVYRFAFLAEEYGEERLTDVNGRVWLPVESDRLLVAARHESNFATITVPRQQRDPMTVHLSLDETLELRSVDRAGLPAGNLPLRVAVRVPGEPDNTLWIGDADDLGVAKVPHFQLLRPSGEGARRAKYGVCLDFPVQPHVTVGFEDPLPTVPLILTAPAHGVLEVSFTDPEGGPLVTPIEYYRLRIDFPGENSTPDAFPPQQGRLVGGFPLAGEHSVKVPIGLHAQISATGQFRPMGEIEEATFPGPIQPREVVTRQLRLGPGYTVVRGEVRGDGLALAGGIARAVLIRGNDQVASQAPTLLPGGAFELVGRSTTRPGSIYLHVRDSRGGEFAREVPLPQAPVVELGAVELLPLTGTIEGAVVDDRGLPVAGAEVQVWRRGNGEWIRDRRLLTVADGDGIFRLSVRDSESGLGLLPRSGGYLTNGPVPPGPEPLKMFRAGELSGSLALPDWLEPSAIHVLLLPLAETGPTLTVGPERIGDLAHFRARGLWPGRYRIQLQLDGEPEPFRDLGVFDVRPAEPTAGDRLDRIDVSFDVFRLELTAVDDLGNPVTLPGAGLAAFVPMTDGTVHKRNVRWRDGRAEVVTSHQSLDFEMVARGYEVWRGSLLPGQSVLRLSRER